MSVVGHLKKLASFAAFLIPEHSVRQAERELLSQLGDDFVSLPPGTRLRPVFPKASWRGVTGDNHHPDRVFVAFDMPDGSVTRLSLHCDDIRKLGEAFTELQPSLAKAWGQKNGGGA